MGDRLSDGSELMFRQVHPNSLDNGIPASDRFRPSARDENMLSIDRSALATAKQSFESYLALGLSSAAVFGLTVSEFSAEQIDCVEDPIPPTEDGPGNPAHALANYSPHDLKNQKLIAKRLQRIAVTRGQLHPQTAQS